MAFANPFAATPAAAANPFAGGAAANPFATPAAATPAAAANPFATPAATANPYQTPGAPAASPFGAPAAAATPFGATPAAASPFGSPAAATPANPFGSPAPATNLFPAAGAPAVPGAGGGGTGNPRFKQTSYRERKRTFKAKNICFMRAYSQKSQEELRYEDYIKRAGGTVPAAASPVAANPANPFGAPGAAAAPAANPFGAPAAAAAPAANPFGAPAATAAAANPFAAPGAAAGAAANPFGAPAAGAAATNPFAAPGAAGAAAANPFAAPGAAPAAAANPFGAPAAGAASANPFAAPAAGAAAANPFAAPGAAAAAPAANPFAAPAAGAAAANPFAAPAAGAAAANPFAAPAAAGAAAANPFAATAAPAAGAAANPFAATAGAAAANPFAATTAATAATAANPFAATTATTAAANPFAATTTTTTTAANPFAATTATAANPFAAAGTTAAAANPFAAAATTTAAGATANPFATAAMGATAANPFAAAATTTTAGVGFSVGGAQASGVLGGLGGMAQAVGGQTNQLGAVVPTALYIPQTQTDPFGSVQLGREVSMVAVRAVPVGLSEAQAYEEANGYGTGSGGIGDVGGGYRPSAARSMVLPSTLTRRLRAYTPRSVARVVPRRVTQSYGGAGYGRSNLGAQSAFSAGAGDINPHALLDQQRSDLTLDDDSMASAISTRPQPYGAPALLDNVPANQASRNDSATGGAAASAAGGTDTATSDTPSAGGAGANGGGASRKFLAQRSFNPPVARHGEDEEDLEEQLLSAPPQFASTAGGATAGGARPPPPPQRDSDNVRVAARLMNEASVQWVQVPRQSTIGDLKSAVLALQQQQQSQQSQQQSQRGPLGGDVSRVSKTMMTDGSSPGGMSHLSRPPSMHNFVLSVGGRLQFDDSALASEQGVTDKSEVQLLHVGDRNGADDSFRSPVGTPASARLRRRLPSGSASRRTAVGTPSPRDDGVPTWDGPRGVPPTLQREGYSTTPSLAELADMSSKQLQSVNGFTVTREGVGSIAWLGRTDVEGLDLDAIITIDADCCTVYEGVAAPPPRGVKLNKPAIVKMFSVAPEDDEDPEEFEAMLRAYSDEVEHATFISYDADTQVWAMHMSHFVDPDDDNSDDSDDSDQDDDSDRQDEASDQENE